MLHGAGIFANIDPINDPNVGKYSIHDFRLSIRKKVRFTEMEVLYHIFGHILGIDFLT